MNRRIGVRFCGGCNPRYDRSAVAWTLRKAFPEFLWESADPCARQELYIVICGCLSACVNTTDLAEEKICRMRTPEELEHIRETLRCL